METVLVNLVPKSVRSPTWVRFQYQLKSIARSKKRKQRGIGDLGELRKDLIVGRDAIWRATRALWWNWDGGSTLYFWRWPRCHRSAVRDGTKVFIHRNKLPSYSKPQQLSRDKVTKERVKGKVNEVRNCGYINTGGVKSITSFFMYQRVIRISEWFMMPRSVV